MRDAALCEVLASSSHIEFDRVSKETFVESMLHQIADGLSSDSRFGNNSANRIRCVVEDIAADLNNTEKKLKQ